MKKFLDFSKFHVLLHAFYTMMDTFLEPGLLSFFYCDTNITMNMSFELSLYIAFVHLHFCVEFYV